MCIRDRAEYDEKTGMVRVKNVDPYRYIAWKDGEFVFERETIEGIMERLSRWYDVKIFYGKESLKQKRFTGVVSRYEDITQVLLSLIHILPKRPEFIVNGKNLRKRIVCLEWLPRWLKQVLISNMWR